MAIFCVRNEADALRALASLADRSSEADPPTLRFEGWPRIVVTVPEGIDVLQGARAVLTIEKLVHRQYCLLKYQTPDLRRLTERDKAETSLGVTYLDRTRLAIDLSQAATAAARAVLAKPSLRDPATTSGDGLFGTANGPTNHRQESWPRTAREVAIAGIRKITAGQATLWGLAAIIVAGIAYSNTTNWKESLSHAFAMQKEQNEHQLRLAEFDRTTIVSKSSRPAAPAALAALEQGMEAEQRRVRLLASLDFEGPFSRFVGNVEYARPALLELARSSTIDINGLTLAADTARAAAKAVRKTPADGWKAVVQRAPAVESS